MQHNPFSLVGKTILITGASSGIGRATAIECSKLGATCIILGRNEDRLRDTLCSLDGERNHAMYVVDVTKEEEVETCANQIPSLDGVVNNAGTTIHRPTNFIKESDLLEVYNTNTFAPMILMKYLQKRKKLNKGASIVFTSSVSAFKSDLGNSIYGSSKAALQSYSRYLAKELAPKGIRSNSIHPGMVMTAWLKDDDRSKEALEEDMKRYPLGRYGQPEDIAYAIIYLLSDASTWVTGHSLVIDGGISTLI